MILFHEVPVQEYDHRLAVLRLANSLSDLTVRPGC